MVIYGTSLAASAASSSTIPLPKTLAGTSVMVDGRPSDLLYVSATQVNALIPFEVLWSGYKKVTVAVTTAAGTGEFPIYVNRNAPALFTVNSAGTGRAHVFDAAFRPVDLLSEQDVVILYATGLGATDIGTSAAGRLLDQVDVFLGDQQAEVLFAGLAPGFPGVYQLNVRVPQLWTDRLYLRQGSWLSNVVQIGVRPQSNADNIVASIEPVLPAATTPVYSSFPLLAARFQVDLHVHANAQPFVVAAVVEGGGSFTLIDPVNAMSERYWTTPTAAAAHGDFSSVLPSVMVMDFIQGCQPFPNGQVPLNQMDSATLNFITYNLPPPEMTFSQYAVGTSVSTASLQPGGRLITGGAFGDFFQIPCGSQKGGKTTFKLYVDGKVVASEDVSYQYAGR
jgi:uncharacterized protein (TIGR03437 family)